MGSQPSIREQHSVGEVVSGYLADGQVRLSPATLDFYRKGHDAMPDAFTIARLPSTPRRSERSTSCANARRNSRPGTDHPHAPRGHHGKRGCFCWARWTDSRSSFVQIEFYDRKIAEGKSSKEAIRALERRLSDVIYRHLVNDARQRN